MATMSTAPPGRQPGRFIVFEGGEGSGKSTQARRLADRLGALLTFEPGDTPVGARLREILLDPATGDLDDRAEALLMAADRAHHVATVIRPALEAGRDVVCDRFVGSSIAYQGYARGLDVDDIAAISAFACSGTAPDLVVHLAVSEQEAGVRLSLGGKPDRMEAAGRPFHRSVAAGYAAQAAAHPELWLNVDGHGPCDEVSARVAAAVDRWFNGRRTTAA